MKRLNAHCTVHRILFMQLIRVLFIDVQREIVKKYILNIYNQNETDPIADKDNA